MTSERQMAEMAVGKIISDIRDRSGFKHLWNGLEPNIAEEIRLLWVRIVQEATGSVTGGDQGDRGQEDPKTGEVGEKPRKLGWTCEIKDGWSVKVQTDDYVDRMRGARNVEELTTFIESLPDLKELVDGQDVLVMSLFGWVMGIVRMESERFSQPHVDSGTSIFPVRRSDDARQCWVTSMQVNKSVLKMDLRR